MNSTRIYMAVGTFHPIVGGIEKQVLAQCRCLREKGYEVTIITFRYERTWLPHEVVEGVPVVRIAGILLGRRGKLPRLLQKLLYLMALVVMGWTLWRGRRRYDVLHAHQLALLTLPIALVCRLIAKPMIVVGHCADAGKRIASHNKASLVAGPLDATIPWLQVYGRASLNGDLERLERLGKPVVRFIRFLLQGKHTVVVVLSSRMKADLAAHGFHLPNVQLIPNGVDIVRFSPTYVDSTVDKRVQIVVCLSRLCYQKGIDVLLQAWNLVHKQAPQARLIIAGSGPLQTQLERLAQALDILDSVEFVGVQGDVQSLLHQSNLAVLPSRWEGMSVAILEAMACGLPCVASRVSGSEDIIQHGVNGLLVEPEDYRGLAEALLTLLDDPGLIQKYGHAARATIEQHYSIEHITDTYIELYRSVVDHK